MLKDLLKETIVEVRFIKKNGEERLMICTLLPEFLPEITNIKKDLPENLITVFDIEENNWRMINLATLIDYEVVE